MEQQIKMTDSSPEQIVLLEEKIESIARKYRLQSSDWIFSLTLPEANKVFLAMLDKYISEVKPIIFDKKAINVLDFGAGNMPYFDAYKTFLERFNTDSERKVEITSLESDSDTQQPGVITNIWHELKSDEKTESILNRFLESNLDIITMFGIGPSSHVTDPLEVEDSYKEAISVLSRRLNDNGLIVLTTSYGGPKRENLLRYLLENGFDIILDKPNIYCQKMIDDNIGFTHEEIVIAKKNGK
jgi:hypothetical protein